MKNNKNESSSGKKKRSRWTKEEENILLKYYGKCSISELISKFNLNRSARSIKEKARRLGITKKIIHKHWTPQDIEELCKEVEKSPYNLRQAYRTIASKQGRTWDAVRDKFEKLRRQNSLKTCMITIGGKAYTINRKNIWFNKPKTFINKNKVSKWRRILKILFE